MQKRNTKPLAIKLSRPSREYCQLNDRLQLLEVAAIGEAK